jgi:hypothetical protein
MMPAVYFFDADTYVQTELTRLDVVGGKEKRG